MIYAGAILAQLWSVDPAAAQEDAQRAGETAEDITPPRLLSKVEIPYPAHAEGRAIVTLKILVSAEGDVQELEVVEGAQPFSGAAREAALLFEFSPAKQGEQARAAWITYRIEFTPPTIEETPPLGLPREGEGTRADEREEIEVRVEGRRRPGVGRVMSDAETQIIPGAEGDPVRAIEAMPGTVPVLASGPFIGLRGASPGMVGYEYDGIALPYLFHLARGPTVVHPWMVESASIYGGGAPARLGRSGAGFIEATSAEPLGRARAAARLRLSDSALGAEVPFADGRGSVLLAGRYSYTRPLVSLIAPEFSLDFWDYQSRVRYAVTPASELEFLVLGAGDRSSVLVPGEPRTDLFHGSFHRSSLRYTRYREGGASQRAALTLGHDRWDGRPALVRPYLYSINVSASATEPVSSKTWLDVGGDIGTRLQTDYFTPPGEMSNAVQEYKRTDLMAGAWVDLTHVATERTTFTTGARLDMYSSDETPLTQAATHAAVQPRFALAHQVTDAVRVHQSMGLLAQPRSPAQRPPGRVYSVEGGLEYAVLSDFGTELALFEGFSFDTTVFHSAFFNVGDVEHLRFLEGQDPELRRGQGQAYGVEVSLRRMLARRLRGFVSYTLSRSTRSLGRAEGLAAFDRPHVVDLALAYEIGQGWSVSSRGTYYRGYPARMSRVVDLAALSRASDHYQIDWQVAKRWAIDDHGRFWGITFGVLNTNLRSESNSYFCSGPSSCEEEMVGPATIPTLGVEGEI